MNDLSHIGEILNQIYGPVFMQEGMSEAMQEVGRTMLYGPLYGPAKPKIRMNPKRYNNPGVGLMDRHCDC
jgi:hypothetical protein